MSSTPLLALVVSALLLAACVPGPLSHADRARQSVEYHRGLAAESLVLARTTDTTYARRMRDLIRRGRLVPIDSLARLEVALATAPDSVRWKIRRAMDCEGNRLVRAHGQAFFRAVARMRDSLARAGFDPERTYDRLSAIKEDPLPMDPWGCDEVTRALPMLPDSLLWTPERTRPATRPARPSR